MSRTSSLRTLLLAAILSTAAAARAELHIAFIDPSMPKAMPRRNAGAFQFAGTAAVAIRWKSAPDGWQDREGRPHAPEEFDLIWFHQGDDPAAAQLDEPARQDLLQYLENGGSLLLSGGAGRLLNDLTIEPTPLRLLAPTDTPVVSGLRVVAEHRRHPAFTGLDPARPIFMTSLGGNALADFYGTAGPHGDLLAHGTSSHGERPLVEYRVGDGRVIFVGWRVPDFTTPADPYRGNLERLFHNLFAYLAGQNSNRARLLPPAGKARYVRLLGVPFLSTAATFEAKSLPLAGERYVAVLTSSPATGAVAVGGFYVRELPITERSVSVAGLAVTLLQRQQPVARFLALRRQEQAAADRHDEALTRGTRILKPPVELIAAPLKPLRLPRVDQSVILGRSPFMAPDDGRGDVKQVYEPIEDGGFRIVGSTRKLNRPIVHGQNHVWTGDLPIFRMDTVTGNGSYAKDERVFPLWAREDCAIGNVYPSMGTLRLYVREAKEKRQWLDELAGVTTVFRPGYTEYQLASPAAGWKATLRIAPAMDCHGFVCRVEFDREVSLGWQYGGMWWQATEPNRNHVEIRGPQAEISEPNLPGGLVLAGWDAEGRGQSIPATYGQQAEFTASAPRRVYHVVAAWGVTQYDTQRAQRTLARLDTPATAAWPAARDRLKQSWLDCYIGRALEPRQHFAALLAAPEAQLRRTCQWWDARRNEFQIRTPNAHLDALVNWERAVSEYHRQGPGLVLGAQFWQMYSHISTGWYGKQFCGDHQAMADCLRFYGAMQGPDGFISWISPSLVAFHAENNTPYWVDQVWLHYAWTGDRQFVRDLWPQVRAAVAWQQRVNDPDGDGLFRDSYEYWNCDSNGKGPKAAAPSAMSWAMLDRAARIAAVVGDAEAEKKYRQAAEKTRREIFRQLWHEDEGRLGSIGVDGLWWGHPQTWEEYLAVNAGLLNVDQGRRAMRWIAAHYGFQPRPGVRLLACSDWWPVRWSVQWVPTGDTCLAALAGIHCGDADLWWPFVDTAVHSAFRSEFPGINMGIANSGAGGGDREDVDSVDPYLHVTVRGLFGIEPALHEQRIDICPSFPADWRQASIVTPDLRYEYSRSGDHATLRIHTPRPLVKRVRSGKGEAFVTPEESESIVTVPLGPAAAPLESPPQPTILLDQVSKKPTSPVDRSQMVLFDLAPAYNLTLEELTAAKFTFDYADHPQPLSTWWGNPTLTMPPGPRVIEAPDGPLFLTAGQTRPGLGKPPKQLLALASWRPYPLPGGAVIPVELRCRRVWLLLQSYVHPMKNYLPNGEVVLRYADGSESIESLIPPFNLDCYFQHFSLRGTPVPLGRLGPWPSGWTPIHQGLAEAHADALAVECDPARVLKSVTLRATCSEGVLGLAGLTAETAK